MTSKIHEFALALTLPAALIPKPLSAAFAAIRYLHSLAHFPQTSVAFSCGLWVMGDE
jgi:hypothetical protein